MIRLYVKLPGMLLLAVTLMAAAPRQEGILSELPWYTWLCVLSALLLLLFVLIVAFDWSGTQSDVVEDE